MSDIQVLSRTQKILVENSKSVSVVHSGPVGPRGFDGINPLEVLNYNNRLTAVELLLPELEESPEVSSAVTRINDLEAADQVITVQLGDLDAAIVTVEAELNKPE